MSRPEGRPLVGRGPGSDRRHRAGDDGGADAAATAVEARPATQARLGIAWRFGALGGFATGLAVAPHLPDSSPAIAISAALGAAAALIVARPVGASARGAVAAWLALVAAAGSLLGVGVGVARVGAIDAGALDLPRGQRVTATGFVTAVPRRSDGEVRVRIDTPDGRVVAVVPEPVPDLPIGRAVRVEGAIRDPDPWESATLARVGVRDLLQADAIELLEPKRGGPVSLLDGARTRAEGALGRGTDPARAALLRGFVLGQDDRIDAATVDQFRRSGLAHLLAVSGQNVLLLVLLAWPLLAVLGVPFRARLVCVLAMIALYVPIAGGGPSIQRAGVMGAAGVVAALAGRPASRWYAVALAAAVTLVLNPRATGDVGWQLSFAALAGIMLWARPLAAALGGGTVQGRPPSLRAALAEGAAVTVAATVATAPLIAVHFDTVSIASLPANLLALPAVAPVMWLGMLAGLLGQASWVPVEPLTALAGALAGYIAQVATWLGSPGWAQTQLDLGGPAPVVAVYAALATGLTAGLRWRLRRLGTQRRPGWPRLAMALAVAIVAAITAEALVPSSGPAQSTAALRVSLLDVGQGDAILLEPRNGEPVLVDAGPEHADVATELSERGIDALGALVVTHPQSDHVGGASEVLTRIDVERLLYARAGGTLRRIARGAGAEPLRIAAGSKLRSGPLRIETLWPPPALVSSAASEDPNRLSLVFLVRWREFELLLTGDAEAEVAPLDPGPVDVLKLAHHGSEDTGLDRLLDRASPRLGLISVGAGNPYGHPAPETLAELEAASVPILRTDSAGTVTIEVDRGGWAVK